MTLGVPNLKTALQGPLLHLEAHLLQNQMQVEAWLREQWLETPAPFMHQSIYGMPVLN